jgi:crotonobetainyl-CoA:carnitine CoA-transferase CaiB-like acyl-CoA transferase
MGDPGARGVPHVAPASELVDPSCRVVELGRRVAAGICGSLLADLGADVVLADTPEDDGFKWRNRSAIAVGKRSVDRAALAPDGALHALVDRADVILLSSDVDADQLALWDRPRRREQVVCDITGFGHSGPLAGEGLPAALVEAYAGTVDTTGQRHGLPTPTGAPFVEMETAVYAASAILAALRVKREHGFGQRLDIAVYDVGVNALATFIPLPLTGGTATRNGNRHPGSSPWNSYEAKDGALVICAPTNDQWARLCAAMQAPDLVHDPRFATPSARLQNVEEIDAAIRAWVAGLTVAECQATLEAHVIPAGPIVDVDELPTEPNIVHRASIDHVYDPQLARRVHVMPSPVRVDGQGRRVPAIPAFDSGRGAVERALAERSTDADRVTGDPASTVRALAGVRIVEIGMNTVAPLAGRQLAALGADVIKVEPPTGDTNRYSPPLREDGGSLIYAISNADKRGIVLDLKQPRDAETLWRLLDTADVLIENLKPGSLIRLGFGPADVRRRHPRLIYCSINGFGHDSAYPGRPALDTVVQAMSGAMSTTLVKRVPTKTGLSLADQLGGQFGLLGVLAALDRRDRTGEGATLDLAMHDCAAWSTQMVWNGCERTRCAIVETRDGFVAFDAEAPDDLRDVTRARALAEAAPGSAAPVLSVSEVLEHPQTRARGLTVRRTAVDGDEWLLLESPLRLCSTPARVGVPMARLGFLDPALAAELGLASDEPILPEVARR